jgi:DNA mismatch endonuclease (patch repair protein)
MADVHTAETRSANMSAIRGKNTKPELVVRKLLFSRGFRYRLHVKALQGAPDIVLPKHRVAIFVHGCFWHGHDCYLFRWPATRPEFWQKKIEQNIARDQRDLLSLKSAGWRVICVWECAVKGRLRWDSAVLGDLLAERITAVDQEGMTEIRHVPPLSDHPG